VLLEINRQRVTSVAQYRAIVAGLRPGAPVALLIYDPASRQRVIQSIATDPSLNNGFSSSTTSRPSATRCG
jgi:S1-C subfamily serine protease